MALSHSNAWPGTASTDINRPAVGPKESNNCKEATV
jgi:hypothetical protein